MLELNKSLNSFENLLVNIASLPKDKEFNTASNLPTVLSKFGTLFHSYFASKTALSKIGALFRTKENRLKAAVADYIRLMNQFEMIPVLFNGSVESMNAQRAAFDRAVKAGNTLKHLVREAHSDNLNAAWSFAAYKIAALKYRIEAENGGLAPAKTDSAHFEAFRTAAESWKQKSDMMVKKELSESDLNKLKAAACYEKFSKIVLADKALLKKFFGWALKDNNGVEQFIEFPKTCARVKSTFLAARTGRLGADSFKIMKVENTKSQAIATEKVITLPFFINQRIEQVSILDESREVELTGNWRLTIKKILDIFAKKNKEIGNLEYFQSTGITNWNAHQLGYWDAEANKFARIDLTTEKWWEQLPVLEEITKESLEKRYDVVLEEGQWLACAKSSRDTPDLDVDGRHGFMEVSIPVGDGNYRIYPIGNFASHFPNGTIELLGFLVATVVGKVAYPDENFFYSHRQIASYPIPLTSEQSRELMKKVQIDMIKSRYGIQIFQFGGENCAYWAQNTLHAVIKNLPNFFSMPIIRSRPTNPFLKGLFTFFRATPQRLQKRVIGAVEGILGASRGMKVYEAGEQTYKSHKTSSVYDELSIYQPGLLHQQIQEKKLKGTITYGHG